MNFHTKVIFHYVSAWQPARAARQCLARHHLRWVWLFAILFASTTLNFSCTINGLNVKS